MINIAAAGAVAWELTYTYIHICVYMYIYIYTDRYLHVYTYMYDFGLRGSCGCSGVGGVHINAMEKPSKIKKYYKKN